MALAMQSKPGPMLAIEAGTLIRIYSFKTLASVRASPSSSIGGSTFFSAASGSLRPEPVSTTTVTASVSTLPSRTSRNSRASGAADAGSANSPSLLASRIWAERISVSVTAAMMPPDSSRAEVAPSQEAGLPMRIAEATVLGLATGDPVTMGAAPIVPGSPVANPRTVASAIRIGNPASWEGATSARDESGGIIAAVTDTEILSAQIRLANSEGLFAEPASAAPLALLFRLVRDGKVDTEAVTVVVLTGSGLKDPDAALKNVEPPIELDGDARTLAKVLKL